MVDTYKLICTILLWEWEWANEGQTDLRNTPDEKLGSFFSLVDRMSMLLEVGTVALF